MNTVCRLCSVHNDNTIFLFDKFKNEYDIVEIIFELTSIQIVPDDKLPKSICVTCANKLIDFYMFRIQIHETQWKLNVKSEQSDVDAQLTEQKTRNEITFVSVKEEWNNPILSIDGENSAFDVRTERQFKRIHHTKRKNIYDNKDQKLIAEVLKKKQNIVTDLSDGILSDVISRKFNCDKCNKGFHRPSRFLAHYRSVHLKQFDRKMCPYCPRSFSMSCSSSSNLRRHIRTIHENHTKDDNKNPTIKCTECDGLFLGTIELYEHSKVHDKINYETDNGFNLNCDECRIDLETYENYVDHLRMKHSIADEKDIKPVRCRWCWERYKNMQGLYSHIRLVHKCDGVSHDAIVPSDMIIKMTIERYSTFLCTICGKVLGSKTAHSNHMLIHSDAKPFACDLCSAKFRHKLSLTHHKYIHTQERNYRCTECNKAFRQRAHLNSHLKTHGIGIKEKHSCSICKKEFLFKGSLREHMWVHKDGLPHACSECGRGFLWKGQMEKHMKKSKCKKGACKRVAENV